jgi:hypothetical protein
VLPLGHNRLLIGTRDVFLFDVSNPSRPKEIAAIKARPRVDTLNGFARLGDTVFAANKQGHIFAVDVTTPATIRLLGARETRSSGELAAPHDAAFCGGLLVIVSPEGFGDQSRPGKLAVYRVADDAGRPLPAEQWTRVGHLEHPRLAGANRVMTHGTFAYVGSSLHSVADRTDCLRNNVSVIALSDPATPKLRGSVDFPDERGPNGLEVAGKVVFAAGGRTVQAIDVSNPDAPRELARFTSAEAFPGGQDDAHDLVYHDGHLFVTAQTSHSLVVLKWTAPAGSALGRIIVPATEEFPRNGESSMVALNNGEILQLYGAMAGTGDWAISVLREIRSGDGGETWTEPRTLFSDPERSLFQPSLTRMGNGEIGLTYTSLLPKRGAFKLFRRSADEGRTWSEPIQISDPALPHTTGPWDKFYTLQSGRVIALLHALLAEDITKNTGPRGTYAMFSDDHGRTWQRAPREGHLRVEDEPRDKVEWGFWEPSLVEHAPGKLYLMARTSTGWLYESRSEDNGETWTEPVRSSVPNPIAPPVLTKIPGTDTLLLLHNPRVALGTERLGGHRTILAYRSSKDAGKTWSEPRTLLEGQEGALWHDYPAILWHEGRLHLATRHIEIFNTNKWTKVSLRHQALPASRFWKL